MQQIRDQYHNSVIYFLLLAAGTVLAFWPTYFSVFDQAPPHAHAHGLAMSAWLLLLISQAWLIRSGRRDLHRLLGRTSFALVPVVLITTLSFAHSTLERDGAVQPRLYIFYLQMQLLVAFTLCYALAIYNRRRPAVHARFMICTALVMIDPILARVVLFYLWEPGSMVPIQIITYTVTDLVLVALIASNFRREWRLGVFPAMLGVFLLLQLPNFMITGDDWWAAFATWYLSLPLP